jgi:hypothetical protein
VHLTGSSASATIRILLDSTLIRTAEVTDRMGIWHDNTISVTAGQTVHFHVDSSVQVYWNPRVVAAGEADLRLHDTIAGRYGDLHPVYDHGSNTLYMFHLSTDVSGTTHTHAVPRLRVSDNFITFTDRTLTKNPTNPPDLHEWFILGITRDADMRWRSAYGGSTHVFTSVSDNLTHWSGGSDMYFDSSDNLRLTNQYHYSDHGGRDPYLFYDPDSQAYYSVVLRYDTASGEGGSKWIMLHTAGADGKFSDPGQRIINFTGRGDMECPQILKIGNRWYVFYSEYGTGAANTVGFLQYRMGPAGVLPQNVDWNSLPEHRLDGGDNKAAQLVAVGDKWYMWGWLQHTTAYGGIPNLPREIFQRSNGTLGARMDEYLTRMLNKGVINEFSTSTTTTPGGSYNRNMILAEFSVPAGNGNGSYIHIRQGSTNLYAGVVRSGGTAYLVITDNTANPLARRSWVPISDSSKTTFSFKMIVDNNIIEAFADDEYAVSASTVLTGSNYQIGVLLSGSGASVSEGKINALASRQNIFR